MNVIKTKLKVSGKECKGRNVNGEVVAEGLVCQCYIQDAGSSPAQRHKLGFYSHC